MIESAPRVLRLTLKRLPFEVMATGEKPVEYRLPGDWIASRLYTRSGVPRDYDFVEFRNGYGDHRPGFRAVYVDFKRVARVDERYSNGLHVHIDGPVFAIHIGEIVARWNIPEGMIGE